MKGVGSLVDRPTQLFYIWIFICKYTNLKDTAGQSATFTMAKFNVSFKVFALVLEFL